MKGTAITAAELQKMTFKKNPWGKDHEALAKTVRANFGNVHNDYIRAVVWRYIDQSKVSLKEARRCVRQGYSSPAAARHDGVLT